MSKEEIELHNKKWFEQTYNNLINKGKTRGIANRKTKISLSYYTEIHHIIPISLGGTNDENNLVLLTYREHIIAHMLLMRLYPDNYGLAHAVKIMLSNHRNKNLYEKGNRSSFTTKELEEIREKSAKYLSESRKGIPKSEETKKKISKAKKGKRPSQKTIDAARKASIGRKPSKETIEKRVAKLKGRTPTKTEKSIEAVRRRVGTNLSEETKEKLSESHKGKKRSEESLNKVRGKNSFMSKKVVGPDGTIYNSIKECSEIVGIPQTTLKNYMNNKPEKGFNYLNPEEAGIKKTIKVQGPDGTVYDSVHSCAIANNKVDLTIKLWIEKYPELGYKYYKD